MNAKRFGKRKANKRPARRIYRKRGGTRKGLAKVVKDVLMSQAETKNIQFFQNNLPVSDYATGPYLGSPSQMLTLPLTPDSALTPIALGTSSQQRIGNKIRLSKVVVRGMIHPRAYQTTNSTESPSNNAPEPFIFKMWIGYQKDTAYNEVDLTLPNFFQEGSTSASPTGTLMDTFRKVNTDKYRIVKTRQFKVGPSVISLTQNTSVANDNQNYANNDFKFCQKFTIDVTKYVVKTLKFNDTNNQPNTRGLFWWMEAIDPAGGNFVPGRFPANLSYELDIEYKDI